MRLWMLLGLIILWPGALAAQTTDATDPNSEYKKTQEFINKTQSKIDRVRGETEARAKEIEALATRVGDIISAMSSQGEDNTNLISEISVLNELLTIERQTTTGLRGDIDGLNKSLLTRDAEHKAAEAALKKSHEEDIEAAAKREARLAKDVVRAQDITAAAQINLSAAESKLSKAEKKLRSALGTIAGHAKTNRVLASDVSSMRQEVRRLNNEIILIKRRRTTKLPRRPTPHAK
jgi:chromosome segregation ATPase